MIHALSVRTTQHREFVDITREVQQLVSAVDGGRLLLGQWQAIYLCEFDGPRERTLTVQLIEAAGRR